MVRLLALAGVSLFVFLIVQQGFDDLAAALAAAGWGLGLLAAWHVVPLTLATRGWSGLVDTGERRLPFRCLLRMRWITESINGLLPVAAVGGDPIRATLLARRGVAGAAAGASVVVDLTVGIFAQIVFALLGLVVLSSYLGSEDLIVPILVGVGFSAAILTTFYLVQRRGLFAGAAGLLRRVVGGSVWEAWMGGARAMDEAIANLYRQRARLGVAAAWRLAGWISGTVEVWLAASLLGHPLSLPGALMLEAMGGAVRAAAFLVPGALGVQEGSYLLLGRLLGLPAETALAISLAKRVRELVLGVPGLLSWQLGEGWSLIGRRSPVPAAADGDAALERAGLENNGRTR